MKRHLFVAALASCTSFTLFAQDLPGFRTSNYNGVVGIFSNPANAAQNNYKWDVNLFSAGVGVGNNNASFSLKNIGELGKDDSLINRFIGTRGKSSNALLGVDIKTLSFLIGIDKKSGIALTSRGRVMLNATDLDGTLGRQIIDGNNGDGITFPYTINSDKNMRVTGNAWSEVGVTYGRVLLDNGNHYIKAGLTAKYLAGVANAYVNVNRLNGTLTQNPVTDDVYLSNATGGLEIGTGGISLEDFDVAELTSFKSSGFGADLGVVYEWRPGYEAGTETAGNKYKLRVGASLQDIGSIKYKKDMANSGGYNIDITGAEALNLNEVGEQPIDEIKDYLDSKPQFFTPLSSTGSNYKVKLPTMLHVDVDYHVLMGLYVNAAAHVNVIASDKDFFNGRYYNSFSVTPRYETKKLGVFLPVNYSELTSFNAGMAFRLGPVYLGSGSLLTALFNSSKQADFFIGVRFGGLR